MRCLDDRLAPGRPVVLARFAEGDRRPHPRPATHEHSSLVFYTGGVESIELRGRWTLAAGDVLLVPAGEPHRLVETRGAKLWGLGFCPTCFDTEERDALLAPLSRVRSGASAVVRIPEARRPFLGSLFAELGGATARPGGGSFAVKRSLVTLILSEVAGAASESRGDHPPEIVEQALRFVERRCLDPISLRDVAAAVQRSPAHLTTLVRRSTGRSVGAWIIAGRLAEARRRLLHTDEVVDVIAERVGYQDPTHFIRMFRRAHGLTPAAWRARSRDG